MAQTATTQSTRELVLERRRAMSTTGKAGLANNTAAAAPAGRSRTAAPAPSSGAAGGESSSVGRAASLARRKAMSSGGKKAIQSKDRIRGDEGAPSAAAPQPAPAAANQAPTAEPEKKGCGCGCDGTRAECQTKMADQAVAARTQSSVVHPKGQTVSRSLGRLASLARREAMSSRGKAGISKQGMTDAQVARAGNPNVSSRDLAKTLRVQRSKNGNAGRKKSEPCGRRRQKEPAETGAAQDAPWKVGASETSLGQTVTGTMVGRSQSVTGDEPSTCRTVTGTEYLGADIFSDFCQSDPAATPRKVTVTTTSHGNSVSGNRFGRNSKVTGNEPGTCKIVTGTEYTSAEQSQAYCGEFMSKSPRKIGMAETRKGRPMTGTNVGRSEKVTGDEPGMSRALTGTQYTEPAEIGSAPTKVGTSATLRGGTVTGTMVGRGRATTGDEAGSCRNLTGDDYVGKEQYGDFCAEAPSPTDEKVGVSATLRGKQVTGTMTDRTGRVTGNEPGTCKAVTGTPYAGEAQYAGFCAADEGAMAQARTRPNRGTPGAAMTGLQPGVGGKMTGDEKGACETVSGTPYVGADQYAQACPATAADAASPDYPQSIGAAPWGQFSVSSPSGGAQQGAAAGGITGSQYEQGEITGPFGMGSGNVTGTEEARFGSAMPVSTAAAPMPATAQTVDGRIKSRITGEGINAGQKITGDDWDRGDHVTGTEGASAVGRNPTMRVAPGMAMAAAMAPQKRNDEMQAPPSKVTGGSGNTDKGALITYSGGARG